MIYKGHTYRRVPGGYEILRNGRWVAWTAGNVGDAKSVINDMIRDGI